MLRRSEWHDANSKTKHLHLLIFFYISQIHNTISLLYTPHSCLSPIFFSSPQCQGHIPFTTFPCTLPSNTILLGLLRVGVALCHANPSSRQQWSHDISPPGSAWLCMHAREGQCGCMTRDFLTGRHLNRTCICLRGDRRPANWSRGIPP